MINSPRVCVQVQSLYIESQSTPDEERFVFAYTVTIRNLGRTLSSCWGVTGLSLTAMAVKLKCRAKVWWVNSRTLRPAKSISIPAVQ